MILGASALVRGLRRRLGGATTTELIYAADVIAARARVIGPVKPCCCIASVQNVAKQEGLTVGNAGGTGHCGAQCTTCVFAVEDFRGAFGCKPARSAGAV
jgi:hypothetical protein